jgi:lipopolysaccharide assembly outer membrane protein LptD (OstA)
VKDVPAFYFPYFVYPIQEDQRSTGILFPRFGTSGQKGRFIGSDFFWAMGRSTDQTFTADYYSEYGWGFGHEFRYIRPRPSRGTFRTYFVRRQQAGAPSAWERDFNWNAVQMLPGKVKAAIQVQESSAIDFQQVFQDSLDLASRRTTFRLLQLQRSMGPINAAFLMDSQDTYFFDGLNPNPDFQRRRHVPSFTLSQSPKKIGKTGIVFGFDGRAETLQIGNQDLLNKYSRFDLNPRLSRSLARSFVTLTPQVQARVSRYTSRVVPGTQEYVEDPLDRRYLEAGVEMRGPSFSRVFSTPGNFYSERYKHTITPEVTYTYRSKFDGFDEIPRFDHLDYLPGTNEVRYGLTQQFLAKRPGATGKPETYEFLSLRVSQTYYVDIAEGQNQFDPNYSSAFFDESGNPAHYSPLQSRLRFRPTPQVSTNVDVEYDVNVKELRNLSFSTNINYRRFGLDARYSRGRFRFLERVTERDTVRGSARLMLVPDRLTVAGSVDYDIIRKNMVQNTARLRYDVQCCGFMIETIESDFNIKKGREWRFNVQLANIGSMGSFLGDQTR